MQPVVTEIVYVVQRLDADGLICGIYSTREMAEGAAERRVRDGYVRREDIEINAIGMGVDQWKLVDQ